VSGKGNRRAPNVPARRGQASAQGSRTRAARTDGQSLEYAEHSYSGPLPAPADLQAYELVVPGAAERIISAFERQSEHRHDLEQRVIDGSESRSGIGQWLAFIVLMTGVIGGCIVAATGEPVAGGTIAGVAFTGGVLSYLVGGRPPKAD
jgi:uncharacterized membrane protein